MTNVWISGANRGIGLMMAEVVGRTLPSPRIFLSCRSLDKAKAAIDQLTLMCPDIKIDYVPVECELESEASVLKGLESIPSSVKFDMVINNAGINLFDQPDLNPLTKAKRTIQVNCDAPLMIVHYMSKQCLLSEDALVLNVSSLLGSLRSLCDKDFRQRLKSSWSATELQLLRNEYLRMVEEGQNVHSLSSRFPEYAFSKLLLSLNTQVLARNFEEANSGVKVLAYCPGWVKTSMGGSTASKTLATAEKDFIEFLNQPPSLVAQHSGLLYTNKRFVDIRQ